MNKDRFIKLSSLLGLGLACLIGLQPQHVQASPEDDGRNFVIDAFLRDPQMERVLKVYDKQGLLRGKPQTMGVSGNCGVAGCGYSVLVAQSFYNPGANPQTFSVFALVHVDPLGSVVGVGRVGLLPWDMVPSVSETQVISLSESELNKMAPIPVEIDANKLRPSMNPNPQTIKKLSAPMTTAKPVLP